MGKPVLLGTLGVVLGTIVGMAIMMGLHMASTVVYPPPEGVDFMDQSEEGMKRLQEWFGTLPTGAFVLATLCHGLGCMSGAVIAALISGRRSLVPVGIVGVIFTVGGIMNLSSIPHPSWFPFVDVPIYLIFALTAGALLKRKDDSPEPQASADQA